MPGGILPAERPRSPAFRGIDSLIEPHRRRLVNDILLKEYVIRTETVEEQGVSPQSPASSLPEEDIPQNVEDARSVGTADGPVIMRSVDN
jgi:hypothetical protein